MEISRIQPNCSECALVVYSDKVSEEQKKFFDDFFKFSNLKTQKTPKGNIAVEICDGEDNPVSKSELWDLKEKIQSIADWEKRGIQEDVHYSLVRDDYYYDLKDDGSI